MSRRGIPVPRIARGCNYDQTGIPDAMELADGATLPEAITDLASHFPDDIPIPPSGLIAVNGKHAGAVAAPEDRVLADADEIMIVAPIASG